MNYAENEYFRQAMKPSAGGARQSGPRLPKMPQMNVRPDASFAPPIFPTSSFSFLLLQPLCISAGSAALCYVVTLEIFASPHYHHIWGVVCLDEMDEPNF